MRWQDALTGAARADFQAFLATERQATLEQAMTVAPERLLYLQGYLRALDLVQLELTREEREGEADAIYRERVRGQRPTSH